MYFLLGTALIIAAMAVTGYHLRAKHRDEKAGVNDWFSERSTVYPPQPLTLEHATVVRNIMDGDSDLWWHLGRGRNAVDRKAYYEQVIEFGRFLRVFGPLGGPYQACYCPSIYYGVFEGGDSPRFRVWIEFHYQGETVWVLTEDGDATKIVRFSEFRVNYPGLVLRHPIYFVYEGLDANINPDLVHKVNNWPV